MRSDTKAQWSTILREIEELRRTTAWASNVACRTANSLRKLRERAEEHVSELYEANPVKSAVLEQLKIAETNAWAAYNESPSGIMARLVETVGVRRGT